MSAEGVPVAAIAKAVGLGRSTLARHYAALLKPLARGRPRHVPTAELRSIVLKLAMERQSLSAIARAVGLAPQTVQRHYAPQLETVAGEGVGQGLEAVAATPVGNRKTVVAESPKSFFRR